MALHTYRRMRRFGRTPEPRGGRGRRRAPAALSFVVQRHAARALHYDFRLELGGALKSWAVPKGPSTDPGQKRLAVHVEDHPLEYGSFHGTIPEGEYGAGTVELWDRGTWHPVGDPEAGYRKGHLRFRLEGGKLRGVWDLVAMRDRKNWLLIKASGDRAAPLPSERRERPAARRPAPARRARRGPPPDPFRLPGAVQAPLPGFIEPQLAQRVARVPEGEGWLHEIKLDGYRILARLEDGAVRLYSRNGRDWTGTFPSLAALLARLPARAALLDGEVVVLDDQGRSHFQALQNALSRKDPKETVYFLFDLLHLDGWDLRGSPLTARKDALRALLAASENKAGRAFAARVRYSDHVAGKGQDLLERSCAMELEGIVSKRADAPYRAGRSDRWRKIKCLNEQEFVIGGYTDPAGSREAFGALLLGVQEPTGLRYVGRVGTGFSGAVLERILRKLTPLRTDAPAFVDPPRGYEAKGVHWVRPELVGQVAFASWTNEGILRQPSFQGLREDKPAADVTRERPAPPGRPVDDGHRGNVVAGVKLSNPGRLLYPEQRITKLGLAAFYERIADWFLPFVARRPLALVRCPSGYAGGCFFQKHLDAAFPAHVKPVDIAEKGETETYLYVSDLPGVISLVQMGVLEFHPWGSTIDALETPDTMTIDLDPGPGVAWDRVVKAAWEVRERLAAFGFESFVKTTGGKGLHVCAPLVPDASWDEVKALARTVAESMAKDRPSAYTARLAKAERGRRIFVDYLRNGRGATAVAAYSTRARPGAPVSTPLAWEELDGVLRADQFTVENLAERLGSLSDPWRGWERARRSPAAILRRARSL